MLKETHMLKRQFSKLIIKIYVTLLTFEDIHYFSNQLLFQPVFETL